MTRSKTGRLLLGSAFVLALAGVTPPVYAHGGDASLVHACVNNSSGEIKIVGANASCKNNQTAVDWPGLSSAAPSQGSIMVHGGGTVTGATVSIPVAGGVSAYRLPRDGTIQNARIFIQSNSLNGAVVVTLLINGNPTSLSVTIPPGSTTAIDIAGSVSALDGDTISVEADASAASSGFSVVSVSYEIL